MQYEEPSPPKTFLRFFRWFCHRDLRKYVEGDLFELYNERLRNASRWKADVCFILDVILLFRPGIIAPYKFFEPRNNCAMLKNYFTIAWRNLTRNTGYSIINIGGLALGMSVAILIGMWVYDEFAFNRYHRTYERVGQIMKSGLWEGRPYSGGFSLQFPLIDELKSHYGASFKYVVEASQPYEYILTHEDTKISMQGQFTGSDVTKMLALEMVHGDWDCLKDPYSILLSTTTAKALFGDDNPMGQLVRINTDKDVKVTGVYKDLPHNTTFHSIGFFAPWDLHFMKSPWMKEQDWDNHFLFIYCQIADNKTFDQVSANIAEAEVEVIKNLEHMKERLSRKPRLSVHPMRDWHLYSDFDMPNPEKADTGPLRMVILVATIGAFVLLLACINFMNLSTARSERRAREVGIRKSMGSVRMQLVMQFFSESYMVVIFAYVLAVVLCAAALPYFNDLTVKLMSLPLTSEWFWLSSAGFVIITGLLAGSYPALYLSSFNPVRVLKGRLHPGKFSSMPRKILVVLQFAVSIALIICTGVIYSQIMFAKDRPVGYTRERLIMVAKKSNDFFGKSDVLRHELMKTGVVEELAESGGAVTSVWSGNDGFTWRGQDTNINQQFGTLGVSTEYGKTVGWQFVAGRDFSGTMTSDSGALVINESAAKIMGFNNPVGEVVHWKNKWWKMDRDFTIIGVVRDMVMNSPYEPAQPTVFLLQGWHGWFNIRISKGVKVDEGLLKIGRVFNEIIPTAPFEYKFADEEYALKFAKEERIGRLASLFSSLAIFISCLGLFGLASFVAEQRTKELSIRKILGASVRQLWQLLCSDFVVLVLVACAVAIPVSIYFMSDWLAGYTYRTSVSWSMIAVIVVGAVVLTLITVTFQVAKAALVNPVKTLRAE